MTSRCCWLIQPASAIRRTRSGCQSGTMAAGYQSRGTALVAPENPSRRSRTARPCSVGGLDRVVGHYGVFRGDPAGRLPETPLSVAISLHVCSAQYLNLVSFEHLDHPFPRRKPNLQRFSDLVVLPAGGQNFRKGSGQNTRNPQRAADSASRRALGSPRPTSSDVFALSTGGPTSETAHDARLKRSSSLSATPRCGSHWRPTGKPASSFNTGEGCPL